MLKHGDGTKKTVESTPRFIVVVKKGSPIVGTASAVYKTK